MASLDGCGKFIKYCIFFVNFFIFLCGIAILGLGIWTMADNTSVQKVLGSNMYVSSAVILLVIGGVISFISFLGCCGAIKEVKCLLMTFFIVNLLVIILVILGVVFAYKIKGEVAKGFEDGVKKTIEETVKEKDLQEAWDAIQKELKCCGAEGFTDWKQASLPVPDSCNCEKSGPSDNNCGGTDLGERTVYLSGCNKKIEELIVKHMKPLAAVGITIIVIIILAMVFSCSLFMML